MVIHFLPDEGVKITAQKLYSSRVPIVETTGTFLDMSVKQEVFSLATDYMKEQISTRKGNREDIVLMTIDNITPHDQIINPVLIINSEHPVVIEKNEIVIGKKERFLISEPIVRVRKNLADFKTLIELSPQQIKSGEQKILAGIYDNGKSSRLVEQFRKLPREVVGHIPVLRDEVIEYWEKNTDNPI